MMDSSLFFARRISDSFIVVSTAGYPDVTVNYENRKVGTTDDSGHLLIPWAAAWYPGKVTLDTLPLPTDVEAKVVEKRIAVREASGALVDFPVTRVRSASITLVDKTGHPLPLGTAVEELTSQQSGVVGCDGLVWFYPSKPAKPISYSRLTANAGLYSRCRNLRRCHNVSAH